MRMTLRWTFFRSAGPEGEGGGFDSPSLPPLDTLPSPKRPGDVPLDPNAEGRSGRLAEKALYCASEVLRIAFSGRHPPCAPIVYARPSGAPAQRSQRNQRFLHIQRKQRNAFFPGVSFFSLGMGKSLISWFSGGTVKPLKSLVSLGTLARRARRARIHNRSAGRMAPGKSDAQYI